MTRGHVLLLGGTGFIGSALAVRLRSQGLVTHVVGRKDESMLERLLPYCGTVVHLASTTTPSVSSKQPALEQANLDLTYQLAMCLKTQKDTHLIFFSSGGTVYGNSLQPFVNEDFITAPISPYGVAKVAQENICRSLRDNGNPVTIIRPSNVYGPGQMVKPGFGLVRTLLDHARHGSTLEIWGDGENVRDYIYIEDVVEATLRLICMPHDSATYNLGSGLGYSVNHVKRIVEQVTGFRVKELRHPPREVDVRKVVLDSTKLYTLLGWVPSVGLVQGVGATWRACLNRTRVIDCQS